MTSPDKTQWTTVSVAVAAGLVGAAHMGKLPPSLPLMRAELGLDLVVAGWIVSIFSLTGMTLGLLWGAALDRAGHVFSLRAGLATLVLGSLLGGFSGGTLTLMASRVLEGFGFLTVVVAAPSIIAAASRPDQRRLTLGIWGTYLPAGVALALLGAPLVLDHLGWRPLWWGLGGVTGLMLLATFGTMPDHLRVRAASMSLRQMARALFSSTGPFLLAAGFAFYTIPWISLMVWLPSFLVDQRGLSTGGAGAVTALVVAANIIGNLAAGWLLHRGVGRWLLMVAASVVMAIASLVLFGPIAIGDGAKLITVILFSIGGGLLPTAVLAGVPTFAPSRDLIGAVNGLMVQGSHIGQVLGPPMVAWAVQASDGSWAGSLWVTLASCALGIGVAILVKTKEPA